MSIFEIKSRDEEGRVDKATGRNLRRPQNKLGKPMSSKTDLARGFVPKSHVLNKNWL